MTGKRLIHVCGDPTVDWMSIRNEGLTVSGGVYYWAKYNQDAKVRLSSQPGGAAMVLKLMEYMIPPEEALLKGVQMDDEEINRPKESQVTTSWTEWREYAEPGLSAFRLSQWREFEPGSWDYENHRLSGVPDLLVIQDSGLGFRLCEAGWPETLSSEQAHPEQIIIRLGQYNDGKPDPLLARIVELGLGDRTTIVTTISDIRSCSVKVGISLSWERMLEEVTGAVHNPACPFVDPTTGNLKFARVVAAIGTGGAVIVEKDKSTLVFDRDGQEGDFVRGMPGQMLGTYSCVVAALAALWTKNPETMDWVKGTYLGVGLARLLHQIGYEVVEEEGFRHLQFPCAALAQGFKERMQQDEEGSDFIWNLGVFTDDQGIALDPALQGSWTILENRLLKDQDKSCQDHQAVVECARRIAVEGPLSALPDVPIERVGGWRSADRQEIEGVRCVGNAVQEYLQLRNPQTPLCVAVFGPPGAGKSFAVMEIARGLGIGPDCCLNFNLSQFNSPEDLIAAFRQIRDLQLRGKMPLVFWDEFDTPCQGQELGWLRSFLAPMQDGEYTNKGVTHPLGGGIYVFAGATRYSFEEFRSGDSPADRAAKKPDFVSRLRAYINIRGVNGTPNSIEDRLYIIRRAFLLHQYLEMNAPQLKRGDCFQIDDGVLNAFLKTSYYQHGARSMQNLVKMSTFSGKRKFELSSLPPDTVIQMHTNAREFNSLTRLGHREMLRVGISGHMALDPERMPELLAGIQRAVDFIKERFPDRYITVFSPLAAGADRLVARSLLSEEASRLIAVLPVSRDEYIKDFGSVDDYREDYRGSDLRQEFRYLLEKRTLEIIEMPPRPTREEAYRRGGFFIAENSDIMIVVWDGEPARGSSGTARTVARALEFGKPVCHIWAGNYKGDTRFRTDVGDKHGRFRHKNFDDNKEWQDG
ncbi:MAG: ATP-binding protein [Chitinophagales bacterium]